METMCSCLGGFSLRVQRHAMYVGPDGGQAHFQQQMAPFTFGWLV